MTAAWPTLVNHRPESDGLTHRLADPRERIEVEVGPARVRRLYSAATTLVDLTWVWTRTEMEIFRAWYVEQAKEGADWITLPVYSGAQFRNNVTARFLGRPEPRVDGAFWRVRASLEVPSLPVTTPAPAGQSWPAGLPHEPVPTSLEPQWHEAHLRSEGEVGPIAVRRRGRSLGSQQLAWDLTPAQYESWRAWYRLTLLDGARWFDLAVWTGLAYEARRCRFVDAPVARLVKGAKWRLSASIEFHEPAPAGGGGGGGSNWPPGVSFAPLADGLVQVLPEPLAATPWEIGPGRRRRISGGMTLLELTWSWTRPELDAFRDWYRDELDEGAAWATLPLYSGATWRNGRQARFLARPSARLRGGLWEVRATLEVPDLPVTTPAPTGQAWPGGVPYQPVPGSLQPQWHDEHLRSEGQAGPIAVRRRGASPATLQLAWDLRPAEFETWRAWYRLTLLDGARWFDLPLWLDGGYATCRCRFVTAPGARLVKGASWRLSASLEVRRLPLGAGPLELPDEAFVNELHRIVHVVWPAEMPG